MDVNDVSHALQKVIEERQAENTWQVDSFDGLSGTNRSPDEARVLMQNSIIHSPSFW